MKALLQRVSEASVTVNEEPIAEIGPGLMILLGVGPDDDEETGRTLASKVARLRVFEDEDGKMNLSLLDTGGSALVVSQFTLYADTRKGLRPSFTGACPPGRAEELYRHFVAELGYLGVPTRTGSFGARMEVALVNQGPVTIMLEEPAPAQTEDR